MLSDRQFRSSSVKPLEALESVPLSMTSSPDSSPRAPSGRRRGRRPKGGKLVVTAQAPTAVEVPAPNIILHLRCRVADLTKDAFSTESIDTGTYTNSTSVTVVGSAPRAELGYQTLTTHNSNIEGKSLHSDVLCEHRGGGQDIIDTKLRNLAITLQSNNASDTKSSCFWCTCGFENPPVYIPKNRLERSYQCYGCFCSPECAAAHLFAEDLDAACRFERYHLLNHLYKAVYGYKESIKPAPDPRYTLDKFCGNLTIEEYREHCTRAGVLLVVDKPLTRVLPELHMDGGDARGMGGGHGKYRLRRKVRQSKAEILSQNFRLTQGNPC